MGLKPRKPKKRRGLRELDSVRHGWTTEFHDGAKGIYPCPTCREGRLDIVKDTVKQEETEASRDGHRNDPENWEPDFHESRFVGLLTCNRRSCQETVVVAGDVIVQQVHDEEEDVSRYVDAFRPRFIHPAPRIFSGPFPTEIANELEKAFSAFWFDAAACANRIRCVVEALLAHHKVKRFGKNDKGKRCFISVDARIREWGKAPGRERLSRALLALKWIGNAGSHAGDAALERSDLYDGFDILKHVLDKVFVGDPHERAVDHIVKGITESRKPRSRHRA